MHTDKPPRLSRDLQRHLGRELGAMGERLIEEPLPARMQSLLERLRLVEPRDTYAQAGMDRARVYRN